MRIRLYLILILLFSCKKGKPCIEQVDKDFKMSEIVYISSKYEHSAAGLHGRVYNKRRAFDKKLCTIIEYKVLLRYGSGYWINSVYLDRKEH